MSCRRNGLPGASRSVEPFPPPFQRILCERKGGVMAVLGVVVVWISVGGTNRLVGNVLHYVRFLWHRC